ncbi:MAG: hypothetical protein V4488_19765 [Pseudomonadota bacterium]
MSEGHVTKTPSGPRYKYSAFFDTRYNTDLSVDLISTSGNPCKKKLKFLTPVAIKDFSETGAVFAGWAGLRRKTVPKELQIVQSPVTVGDNQNPFHCDIVRNKFRDKERARALAYQLLVHAEHDALLLEPH